jgi:P pilus assembly chaperone PapD
MRSWFLGQSLIAFAALFVAAPCEAEISLSQIIIDVAPGEALVRDVEVANLAKDKAYIEVTVFRIANPGDMPMKRETAANPNELGLLATPAKMVLAPESARLIRLILLNPPDASEHVWRVSVVPKVGEIADDRTGVKLVIGYEMLVFQRPETLRIDVSFTRQGKVLTATNNGNTNVLIPALNQCTAPEICQKSAGTRVYPGRSEVIKLSLDGPVDISLQAAGRNWVERQG